MVPAAARVTYVAFNYVTYSTLFNTHIIIRTANAQSLFISAFAMRLPIAFLSIFHSSGHNNGYNNATAQPQSRRPQATHNRNQAQHNHRAHASATAFATPQPAPQRRYVRAIINLLSGTNTADRAIAGRSPGPPPTHRQQQPIADHNAPSDRSQPRNRQRSPAIISTQQSLQHSQSAQAFALIRLLRNTFTIWDLRLRHCHWGICFNNSRSLQSA